MARTPDLLVAGGEFTPVRCPFGQDGPMRPMLASQGTAIPAGPSWVHEVKWDGMRVLADVHEGRLTLTSRTGKDVTATFPELAGLALETEDALLDGEVVALEGGVPSFTALAVRRPVTFMVFDILRLYGVDLTSRALSERRATLERVGLEGAHRQVPPVYDDGRLLQEATRENGLEGVVSKRLSSKYHAGRRSS